MRNTLLSFLALLMFVPSLACAMPSCVQSLESSLSKSSLSIEKPCHEHASDPQKSDHVRFVIDCMGVDLQKADAVSFDRENIQPNPLDHMFISDVISIQNIYKSGPIIRGSLPGFMAFSYPAQAVILTTQRLRI